MTVVDSFGRQTAIEELGSEVKLGVQDGFSDLDVFRQLYASVFGVPFVSAFVSRTAPDLEAGVVAVRSHFVEAMFRKDALGSESPVEPTSLVL